MKLKILTRRDREGGSWDTSFFPLSFLLLRLSAFLLGALIYFFTAFLSLSHLKWVKMGQNGSKWVKKPGMSHNDQQPQQHTAWGTTLACAAENKTRMNIAHGIQSYILEAPVSPLAPCPHTANTSSTGLLSPSRHADKI